MNGFTLLNHRFKPHWAMVLIAFLAITFFVRLGFWQLQRANEKQQMIAALKTSTAHTPIAWHQSRLPAQYQQIKTQGQYLPTVFLLDNQHYEHQFGFDVLSPLLLADGQVVLVDRGWVAANLNRRELPVIKTPAGIIEIVGRAYYPSEKNWLLGPVIEKKEAGLAILELVDAAVVSQFLHKSVYPFIIRLRKDAADGYVREWAVVSLPPERHYGYAFQWFAIALAIFILFIVLNLKKKL